MLFFSTVCAVWGLFLATHTIANNLSRRKSQTQNFWRGVVCFFFVVASFGLSHYPTKAI